MNPVEKAHPEFFRALDPKWLAQASPPGGPPLAAEFQAADLPRLSANVLRILAPITWSMQFEPQQHAAAGLSGAAGGLSARVGQGRWRLSVTASLELTCERCLLPMTQQVQARRGFEFVGSAQEADMLTEAWLEDQAADPELAEIDFLSPEDNISLRDLVEDEVLLCLPPSPKHPACQPPAQAQGPAADSNSETTQPFSGLKDLIKLKNRA
jgi:uncharacterized metal-binding protein YceD (DUF177 family)